MTISSSRIVHVFPQFSIVHQIGWTLEILLVLSLCFLSCVGRRAKHFRDFLDLPSDWLSISGSNLGVHNFLVTAKVKVGLLARSRVFNKLLNFNWFTGEFRMFGTNYAIAVTY